MDQELEALAEAIAQRVKLRAKPPPTKLALVPKGPAPKPRTMDAIERESRIRWIQALARVYRPAGMDLIVKQAMIGKRYMSDLDDDELTELLNNIDRARDCLIDGITFEEAGLLRSHG